MIAMLKSSQVWRQAMKPLVEDVLKDNSWKSTTWATPTKSTICTCISKICFLTLIVKAFKGEQAFSPSTSSKIDLEAKLLQSLTSIQLAQLLVLS